MKIEIWNLKIPSKYENIIELKNLIGESNVNAFSIDLDTNDIVEGKGCIKSNESYNYHNNYDNSEDCMWFNNKQQWFTLNHDRAVVIQKENARIIIEKLKPILDKAEKYANN